MQVSFEKLLVQKKKKRNKNEQPRLLFIIALPNVPDAGGSRPQGRHIASQLFIY